MWCPCSWSSFGFAELTIPRLALEEAICDFTSLLCSYFPVDMHLCTISVVDLTFLVPRGYYPYANEEKVDVAGKAQVFKPVHQHKDVQSEGYCMSCMCGHAIRVQLWPAPCVVEARL